MKKSKENFVINKFSVWIGSHKTIYSGYLASIDFHVFLAYEMKVFRF